MNDKGSRVYKDIPQIKFLANVPVIVKLLWDKPLTGTKNEGQADEYTYSKHTVELDGIESFFWGNDWLDKEIQQFKKGDTIRIEKKEIPQEGKKNKIEWKVNKVLFGTDGSPAPDREKVNEGLKSNRAERFAACLKDAYTALIAVPELTDIRTDPDSPLFTLEDVRIIATTLFIEEQKMR